MLWTMFVILLVLWLLGIATGTTFGGLVHLLIVLALIVLIFNLISGRRSVA
jgi:uncharacterized protein DUF5670